MSQFMGQTTLAVLRHMNLNLVRQETSSRVGIHAKRLKVGWDNEYLQRVWMGVFRRDCPVHVLQALDNENILCYYLVG